MKTREPEDMYCQECGYSFINTASDWALHQEYHLTHLQGLAWPAIEGQNVIYSDEHAQILKVDSLSSPQIIRRTVQLVELGRREHGYDFPLFEEKDPRATVFIKTISDRAAGVVIIEDINKMVHWPAYPVDLNRIDKEPIFQNPIELPYGLRFIWTAKAMRRRGIARELIERALQNFDISIQQLAWQFPLADCGLRLTRALVKGTLSVYSPVFPD